MCATQGRLNARMMERSGTSLVSEVSLFQSGSSGHGFSSVVLMGAVQGRTPLLMPSHPCLEACVVACLGVLDVERGTAIFRMQSIKIQAPFYHLQPPGLRVSRLATWEVSAMNEWNSD